MKMLRTNGPEKGEKTQSESHPMTRARIGVGVGTRALVTMIGEVVMIENHGWYVGKKLEKSLSEDANCPSVRPMVDAKIVFAQ